MKISILVSCLGAFLVLGCGQTVAEPPPPPDLADLKEKVKTAEENADWYQSAFHLALAGCFICYFFGAAVGSTPVRNSRGQ